MDPVSAGASVLAFVSLALKSAKTIHDVLSAVKDGPQSLHNLLGDIAQLQGILERLSNLRPESISEGDASVLKSAASRCADDVDRIERKLQRLNIQPTDRGIRKFWKQLRTTLNERDLTQMQGLIRGHLTLLSVQLGLSHTSQLSQMHQDLKHLKEASTLGSHRGTNPVTAAAQPVSPTMDTDATSGLPGAHAIDLELEQSLSRLIEYIGEKESTVASEDAQQMVDDLETLLQVAEREELKACGQDQNVSQDLKRMGKLLAVAPTLALNGTGPSRVVSMLEPGMILHQDRKRKAVELPGGYCLALEINRRKKQRRDGSGDASPLDFTAKAVVQVRGKSSRLVISVNQAQLAAAAGSFLSIQRLLVHAVVSSHSPIFELAKAGKTQNILELVGNGQASLHHRDENGWSVLHHGVEHGHLALCKRMIQLGLDVDEVAGRANSENTPLHLAQDNIEMAKTLLKSGADPTIDLPKWAPFYVCVTERHQRHDLWQHMFAFAAPFVNLQERDPLGQTPFLIACESVLQASGLGDFESQTNIETLALFLRKGASTQERGHNGSTCLHVFFTGISVSPREQDWHDSLKFLIDQGADVYATDDRGRSVSHVAYSRSCMDEGYWSYRGDLWDAVLDACDYDIQEFRQGYPRAARYTPEYTRSDFEALWKGREERCPYWNDSHWVSPRDGIGDKSEDLCHCYNSVCWKLDGSTDEASDMELGSGQSQGTKDDEGEEEEDDMEEEENIENDTDEEEGQEDQEGQGHHTPWGRFLPSWEPIPKRDASPVPSLKPESERPPASSSHAAGEAPVSAPGEAAETVLWSGTAQYGNLHDNPWLDE